VPLTQRIPGTILSEAFDIFQNSCVVVYLFEYEWSGVVSSLRQLHPWLPLPPAEPEVLRADKARVRGLRQHLALHQPAVLELISDFFWSRSFEYREGLLPFPEQTLSKTIRLTWRDTVFFEPLTHPDEAGAQLLQVECRERCQALLEELDNGSTV
jgi:hypothetical protein